MKLIKMDGNTLAKTHRAIQQWEQWLTQGLGSCLLEAERKFLPPYLADCYGKHAVLAGVAQQSGLLKFSAIPHQSIVSPLIHKNKSVQYIESNFSELPLLSASVDLVLLPHTFEYLANPQQLLIESCRIVKPDGWVIIFGFNPFSLWGLKKRITKQTSSPWSGNFIPAAQIKHWLNLADFEVVKHRSLLFRPPLENHLNAYHHLMWMDWLGSHCWAFFGGVYMLMAQAKISALTPIKLRWKAEPSSASIPRTAPLRNL
jgi:SAM-dependent methyltransferase